MLQRLKDAGLVLCTATSKPTQVVTPILEEKGLAGYFDFIGGASMDESRDTKTDVVRHVLAQPMMQGRRVLMVGDRNDDMRGAADCAGCRRCAVRLRQQGRAGTLPPGAAGRKLRQPCRPDPERTGMTGRPCAGN